MKIQINIIRYITFTAGIAAVLASANAQTWTGGGDSTSWNGSTNWTTAPAVTGSTITFTGGSADAPTVTNNNSPNAVTSLNSIIFAPGAERFVLEGGGFALTGSGTANNSGKLQIIRNAITLNNNLSQIHANSGELRIEGAIGQDAPGVPVNRGLDKHGLGTLTLAGANTFTGRILLRQGELVLDASSGGSLAAGTGDFGFGTLYFSTPSEIIDSNQGGTFKVIGAAGAEATTVNIGRTLYLNPVSGANRIVVDSNGGAGTTLQFTNFNKYFVGFIGHPTLNVDLSSTGSALQLDAVASTEFTNGSSQLVTVTDAIKTGFATRDAVTGRVTRLVGTTALPVATGNAATNYHTGSIAFAGNVFARTVTINSGGEMSGAYNLNTSAILMEEGAGEYEINVNNIHSNATSVFIHQYSANTLIISSNVGISAGSYSNLNFVKTGSGAVVFNGSADTIGGALDVQQGVLEVNGSVKDVGVAQVRRGATLAGSGKIGGGIQYGAGNSVLGDRYTQVNVWSGGTLDGSYGGGADALDITGKLTLSAGATFDVTLTEGSGSAVSITNITPDENIVTLDGDLKLTLAYMPTLLDEINLLTTAGGLITGEFATINGMAVLDSTFTLDGNYTFEINYGANRVWLEMQAIPEPGSTSLVLLAGAFFLTRCRRK